MNNSSEPPYGQVALQGIIKLAEVVDNLNKKVEQHEKMLAHLIEASEQLSLAILKMTGGIDEKQ